MHIFATEARGLGVGNEVINPLKSKELCNCVVVPQQPV